MPADTDVLLAGSSPLSFSSNYLTFAPIGHEYDEGAGVLARDAPQQYTTRTARTAPLDFPTALSSGPQAVPYLGHSPPLCGTSPPTHFTFHGRCSSPTLRPVALARTLNQLRLAAPEQEHQLHQMPVAVPRRPCLVVRCDVLDLASPSRNKKKVVFADDRGFPLTLVSAGFRMKKKGKEMFD